MSGSIKDVAAKAGVSIATVSHVLNGTQATKPETKRRVMAAVHALGYTRNQAGRDLALGRSSLLGFLVSDIRNPFFPEITAAFQDEALVHEMDALVVNTNYDRHRTLNSVKRLIGLRVPGVAVMTSQIDPNVIKMLEENEVAAVYLDLGEVGKRTSNIVVDYEHGIAEILDHLVQLGHRTVGYVGGPPQLDSSRRRKQAFQSHAAQVGIDADILIDSDLTVKGGYFACAKLLARWKPTAIVAANDLMAIGVLHRAHDGGLSVPADLSVVGFDDILFAEYAQPALTTAAIPREEIGRVAFRALWGMIEDPAQSGKEYRVPTSLTLRQSTTRAAIRNEYATKE